MSGFYGKYPYRQDRPYDSWWKESRRGRREELWWQLQRHMPHWIEQDFRERFAGDLDLIDEYLDARKALAEASGPDIEAAGIPYRELRDRWEERMFAVYLEDFRGDRWSDHLRRSKLGPNVFFSRIGWLGSYLIRLGYPWELDSVMFGPVHRSVAFADGGWFARRQSYSFGIGGLHGDWVVGFAALRHVCDLLGLVPPRRLKGEAAVPDPELLRGEVERQMTEDGDLLVERAKLLLTPETQYSYLPDAVFAGLGIERPRFGLGEADTAVMLDAGSREFLARVGGAV